MEKDLFKKEEIITMRCLFVSDNAINGFGGGSLENKKYYDALKKYCLDNNQEFKVISLDKQLNELLGIKVHKNKLLDILARALGHSSFLYFTWIQNLGKIVEYHPDILVLGRSRLGFMAKSIKKKIPTCKVITNVDNVEYDYVDGYFGQTIRIKKIIEKICVHRDELDSVVYSDRMIFLTERNLERYKDIYKYKSRNKGEIILPICLEKEVELKVKTENRNIVFIGSLNYKPNVLAVKRLVENIWKNNFSSDNNVRLIIAGKNPTNELEHLISGYDNIKLIADFNDISSIVPKNSMMLAPIDSGAGMKVKIAESLAMGLIVSGSKEAFVGYEPSVNVVLGTSVFLCESDEDYVNSIHKFLSYSDTELDNIKSLHKELYRRNFSYQFAERVINTLLNEMGAD